jgi:hypothetical protein
MPKLPKTTVKPGYKPQSEDTSVDTDVLMFSLLRQLSPEIKRERVQILDRSIRKLSPVKDKDMVEDPISLAKAIATILERLNIPYYVGGSLASSLLGEPRYSEDLDMVIAIASEQRESLIQEFERPFYISEAAVDDALSGRCFSFNVISLASAEKVDLFVSQPDAFSTSKMARRIRYPLDNGGSLWVCSPEDMILQKLIWGRRSNSQKQWRDVLGVLKVQGEKLDYGYLAEWADRLGILAALEQAMTEAGI